MFAVLILQFFPISRHCLPIMSLRMRHIFWKNKFNRAVLLYVVPLQEYSADPFSLFLTVSPPFFKIMEL